LVFRPDLRWRWNHGFTRITLDDGAFGRAVHQTDGALWIDAAPVDFQKMLRRRRNDNGVDIDFAAHDIAHAAFGAFFVIDFQSRHIVIVFQSFKTSKPVKIV
jgi:hypothetical protein